MAEDNWIKRKLETQRQKELEQQQARDRDRQQSTTLAKQLTDASYKVFAQLIAAIRADVERLNQEKQKEGERFSIRTDDYKMLEFYKIGPMPDERLHLYLEPQKAQIVFEQFRIGTRRSVKGQIAICIGSDGIAYPQMATGNTVPSSDGETVYQHLSRELLSPTF